MKKIYSFKRALGCFALLITGALVACTNLAGPSAFDLRVESLQSPQGVDVLSPRFSWKLPAPVIMQQAYRIVVSTNESGLESGEGVIWDSEKVVSDQSHLVSYTGKELHSFTEYFWRVKTWDEQGNELEWSDPAVFRTGVLDPSDWKADWVMADAKVINNEDTEFWMEMALLDQRDPVEEYEQHKRNLLRQNGSNIVLYKTFEIDELEGEALMYASAQGYYTVYINGNRVGELQYEPAIGYINGPLHYDVQDVTRYLNPGKNEIRIVLTRGRHGLSTSNNWEAITSSEKDPSCILQVIETGQENNILVKTDLSWKQAPGSIIKGFFYLGEVFDGSIDELREDLSDGSPEWNAVTVEDVDRDLKWRNFPPERIIREVTPVDVFSPAEGVWVFDLGEMITGTVRWTEPQGMNMSDRVLFRYTQRLKKDGWDMKSFEISYPDEVRVTDPENMVFRSTSMGVNVRPRDFIAKNPSLRKALRGWFHRFVAIPTDLYLCSGKAGREWTGTERTHAFRYVEVTGLKQAPDPEDLAGLFIHTDLERIGGFECSDSLLNDFYALSIKTELMNEHGISTDCWDREKWSWNGETVGKGSMMMYNYDISNLYEKHTEENKRITFDGDGHPSPNTLEVRLEGETICWEQSMVQLPWFIYTFTGDIHSAQETYDAMVMFLKHYYPDTTGTTIREARWGDHLWKGYHGLGNNREKRRNEIMGTVTLFQCFEILEYFASELGKEDDLAWIQKIQEKVQKEIPENYFDDALKTYGNDPVNEGYGGDCENSLVAHTGLLDERGRAEIAATVAEEITRRDFSLISGTQTMWRTLDLLVDFGYDNVAYKALSRDDYPGLRHVMEISPDGLAEKFYSPVPSKAQSNSHATFAQISRYFHYGLGGIKPDINQPGFKHFYLSPSIPEGLERSSVYHESPYGRIISEWTNQEGSVEWKVTIPPNSSATIMPGDIRSESLNVNGKPLSTGKTEKDAMAIELMAGEYIITWKQ